MPNRLWLRRKGNAGFTLIEALVALAVLAVSASFLLSATENHARSTVALSDRMVAHWVAQNQLVRLEAGSGDLSGTVTLAGSAWRISTALTETDDPDLLRADISVAPASDPDAVMSRLTGFLDRMVQG